MRQTKPLRSADTTALDFLSHNFRASHRVSQDDIDMLKSHITDEQSLDASSITNQSLVAVNIPGNITISDYIKPAKLEVTARVFNTTELLETVLLFLPVKTLLRLEGTCKGFQRAIEESVKVRRLMRRAPDFSAAPSRPNVPLPRGLEFRFTTSDTVGSGESSYHLDLRLQPASIRQSPSFRRMLYAQPPITEVSVRVELVIPSLSEKQVVRHSGVTFGDVLDAVGRLDREAEKYYNCPFIGRDRVWYTVKGRGKYQTPLSLPDSSVGAGKT